MNPESYNSMKNISDKYWLEYLDNDFVPTPEMAEEINQHVKEYGDHQIWVHFSPDNDDPAWWDSETQQVKPLNKVTRYVIR